MACEIELKFKELRLLIHPKMPTCTIGHFNGCAEISIAGNGYTVDEVYLRNTAPGARYPLIKPPHSVRNLFVASVREQFDRQIRDLIREYLDEAA